MSGNVWEEGKGKNDCHADKSEDKEKSRYCAWTDYGRECTELGIVSPTTMGDGPWYCAFHFACLREPDLLKDPEMRVEFFARERRTRELRRPNPPDPPNCSEKECVNGCSIKHGWNPNDKLQLKGLVVFGVNSTAFKKSPTCMQEAVKHMIAQGEKSK